MCTNTKKLLNVKKKLIHAIFICNSILLLIGCNSYSSQKQEKEESIKDSIILLVKASKKKKNTNILKLGFAQKAHKLATENKEDSLWFAALDRVTILEYRLRDFQSYKKNSERYLIEAMEKKDSTNIAKGSYKLGSYYFRYGEYDSAFEFFNRAQVIFVYKADYIEAGKNLLNMAIIQANSADYYGSQETSLTALKYLKNEKKKRYTLSVYNNLGIVSNELKLYSDAIHWFQKSLELATRDQQKISVFNNLGLVYRKEKNYQKALQFFQKGLEVATIDSHLSQKAALLDNIGYTYFLLKKGDALLKMKQAFILRKKQNSLRGQIVSNLHIGEYYFSKGKILEAKTYFKEALQNAKKIKDIKNMTKALFLLSKTVSNNNKYIKRYAEINDSLIAKERLLKYQFASIQLATSERNLLNTKLQKKLVLKNLNLEKEQNRTLFLLVISLGLVLILLAVYFYSKQQKRIQKQRHIIDTLEARSDEKQNLSMYLHDDIASDLLIGLQRVDWIQKDTVNKELEVAMTFFERAYQKMRKISQNLSSKYFGEIPFEKRIDKLCHEYSFNNDIQIKHIGSTDIQWNQAKSAVKETIYSLLQEAINNVFKHARATSIIFSFFLTDKDLLIIIKDNGLGYQASQKSGLGIQHMRKRTKELSGKFTIKNNVPKKGTTIEIFIPKKLLR